MAHGSGETGTATAALGATADRDARAAEARRRIADVGLGEDDRRSWGSFAVALLLAGALHGAAGAGATKAPAKKVAERIEMAVYRPPPPPPQPEPPPPPPPPKEEKPPPPKPKPPPPKAEPPPPPPPNEPPPPEPPKEPVPIVTGISMSSTVKSGADMKVRVGNTTYGDPNQEKLVPPSEVKPYAGGSKDFAPVRQASISREAQVLRDVKAPYPRDLADQGIEGVVVLLVDVTRAGATRSARVVKSSGHPILDKLALEAVKKFTWRPAEAAGEKVDSRLRYTYRFELYD